MFRKLFEEIKDEKFLNFMKAAPAEPKSSVKLTYEKHEKTTQRYVLVLSCSSCPALCDPMEYSLLGSSVHRISQERILEWVAISSRGSS